MQQQQQLMFAWHSKVCAYLGMLGGRLRLLLVAKQDFADLAGHAQLLVLLGIMALRLMQCSAKLRGRHALNFAG
jgi:hypothetical protein